MVDDAPNAVAIPSNTGNEIRARVGILHYRHFPTPGSSLFGGWFWDRPTFITHGRPLVTGKMTPDPNRLPVQHPSRKMPGGGVRADQRFVCRAAPRSGRGRRRIAGGASGCPGPGSDG